MTSSAARLIAAAVAVCAISAFGAANAAENRHVEIDNQTGHTIVEFYASNVDENDWEEDILGRDTLDSGESVDVNIDDGTGHCMYDFKAVFSDGDTLIKRNINVCTVETYTYTE
ncbi:MAG: hypothetical protein ACXW3D_00640 [Caulobacteraceae bacterium]